MKDSMITENMILSEVSAKCGTSVSANGEIPTAEFCVRTDGAERIRLSYSGEVTAGESAVLEACDRTTGEWRELAFRKGCIGEFTLSAELPTNKYALNGILNVRVRQLLVGNGSDRIAWTTDGQYYLDGGLSSPWINHYKSQLELFSKKYADGGIAYVANTGDLIEHPDNADEYGAARMLHDRLDASVPNGVVSGNHDVGDFDRIEYGNWRRFFGEKYYADKKYYGGGYLDNTSHYDLITIGGRDFIFLYLGMGYEATADSAAWADGVLKMYSHRTAVLCLHEYLTYGAILNENANAREVWEKLIVPNGNVRLVLCGHDPGVERNIRTAPDGRNVAEIMHCYQFHAKTMEKNEGGRGLFRFLTFGTDSLTSRVCSASYPELTSYYGVYGDENFDMPLSCVGNDRRLITHSFAAEKL